MKRMVLANGYIVISEQSEEGWKISSVSCEFLDWIRESFGNLEGEGWRLTYLGYTTNLIQVHDERIITMAILRWA